MAIQRPASPLKRQTGQMSIVRLTGPFKRQPGQMSVRRPTGTLKKAILILLNENKTIYGTHKHVNLVK